MTSLHQVLPLVKKHKTAWANAITRALHQEKKPALLAGHSRTYAPLKDDGLRYPDESQIVQTTVSHLVGDLFGPFVAAIDGVATVDATNATASAPIVLDNVEVTPALPATVLLSLEKFLTDLRTFIVEIPTLDPSVTWQYDGNAGLYRSTPTQTIRTDKVKKVLVKYEATDKHAAQTEVYDADEPVGTWTMVRLSGALPADDKARLIARVEDLQAAVQVARGKANEATVVDLKPGKALWDAVFHDVL